MIAEAVGGWLSGSLALISDAGHMLTDAAALGLALLAVLFGNRPADEKRTYGFRRLEVLAAQLNVVALLGLTVWVAIEALERFQTVHPPIRLPLMAAFATLGLLCNLIILVVLRNEHGLNARSAFLHVVSDTFASMAVLLGAGAMALWPALTWIDPALSLAIAVLILWGAFRLVLEITDILMEAVPRHLDVAAVQQEMQAAGGVLAVHDLHIWTISSGLYALSAHLVVRAEDLPRTDAILTAVKAQLHRHGIDHTTLQIESRGYEHVHDVHSH
jgi:cobalt-zinc-cadmium efflux system protein